MKTIKKFAITLLLAVSLTACGGGSDEKSSAATEKTSDMPMKKSSSMEPKDSNVIAIVNGKNILEENFAAYVKQRKAGKPKDSNLSDARMLDEFINFELALQDAEKKGLQENKDIKKELENQRRTLLVNAAFNDYVLKNPLTDEEMRKDYESRMSELKLTEYRLRHILLTNGDDATAVMKALNKGGDFLTLVKKYSTGPSASEEGLLGWQSEFDLLPEFRAPISKLKKGEYARTPIKTQFGWHILYLDDIRITPPPKFEDVKDRVRVVLQRRQVEDYFLKLRTSAEINIVEFEDSAPNIPQHQGVNIKSYSNN